MSKKDKEIDMLQMVEKHKKDLDYVKEEGVKLKKLNSKSFMPKTYKDVLVFCLNVAEYCGEEDDIKFLKSLPQLEVHNDGHDPELNGESWTVHTNTFAPKAFAHFIKQFIEETRPAELTYARTRIYPPTSN